MALLLNDLSGAVTPRTALICSNNPKLHLLPLPHLELHQPRAPMLGLNMPHTGLHTVTTSMILSVSSLYASCCDGIKLISSPSMAGYSGPGRRSTCYFIVAAIYRGYVNMCRSWEFRGQCKVNRNWNRRAGMHHCLSSRLIFLLISNHHHLVHIYMTSLVVRQSHQKSFRYYKYTNK